MWYKTELVFDINFHGKLSFRCQKIGIFFYREQFDEESFEESLMPTWNKTIFYTCVCVKVTGYSLMDIPCTGFCPFLPRYPQLPVWHPLTWRQTPHLYQQSQMVQPLSLWMSGFAWEEKRLHFKTGPCQEKQQTHPHFFFFFAFTWTRL